MSRQKAVFNDKQRILRLYSILISKQAMSVDQIEDLFFIGQKTVQRDIAAIREFLSELQINEEVKSEVVYDRKLKKYKITNRDHLFELFDKINSEENPFFY
ncbi:kinase [Fructobacillus sp. M2-14]|uniref:Kinase n=1 Tax=Fructobacillus broussonetiae TaxID=2713173 RepID=A0ABS5QZS2_9LACO|nr:kinase [Fructobacillus broussonetiae]MBS9338708.1 kinase [Fructobacillus broussonetiae]